MTSQTLDQYFRRLLDLDAFASIDASMNGLQVDNDGKDIKKVAFAVDACKETFLQAVSSGADLLFVHHGLFWGKPLPISGVHRERLRILIENNIALYAVHLPLDQHPELGNNAALSDLVGIEKLEPFGLYHGKKIGYKGNLAKSLSIEEAARKISFMKRPPLAVYPFGKDINETCALLSGSASSELSQAVAEHIDLFITGEVTHSMYHFALESRINLIAAGHYTTEVWGVQRVMERLAREAEIEVEFYDIPTGL